MVTLPVTPAPQSPTTILLYVLIVPPSPVNVPALSNPMYAERNRATPLERVIRPGCVLPTYSVVSDPSIAPPSRMTSSATNPPPATAVKLSTPAAFRINRPTPPPPSKTLFATTNALEICNTPKLAGPMPTPSTPFVAINTAPLTTTTMPVASASAPTTMFDPN